MSDYIITKWEYVQVNNHKNVGKTIEQWQANGWKLNTYQTAGMGAGPMSYTVNHYLLFEKLPEKLASGVMVSTIETNIGSIQRILMLIRCKITIQSRNIF